MYLPLDFPFDAAKQLVIAGAAALLAMWFLWWMLSKRNDN